MATSIHRLPKTCTEPGFICHDGVCNTDLVADTIRRQIAPRCHNLLHIPKQEEVSEGVPIKLETSLIAVAAEPSTAGPGQVQPTSTVIDLISDVWNGAEPINYHAQIHIGTPPLPFYVDLDTGSSLLWLQAVLSPEQGAPLVGEQSVYRPPRSLSQNRHTKVSYADGASLIASLYTDTVGIGSLTATSQTVGAAAIHNIRDDFRSSKSTGIMGLGDFGRKNVVLTLKSQGKMKHASIALIGPRNDPKLADKIDREKTLQPRGHLVVGSVERSFYTGEIAWCPIAYLGSQEMWLVKLDEVRINGKTVAKNQRALIDTGTAYIVVSQPTFATVKAAIPGAEDIKGEQVSMFSFPEANLRSVEFFFGGRSMELRRQDFGLGQATVGNNRMCSSIVQIPGAEGKEVFAGREHMWIIGGIFLDNIVTIFDYEKKRVGFATIAADGEVAAGV